MAQSVKRSTDLILERETYLLRGGLRGFREKYIRETGFRETDLPPESRVARVYREIL